MQKPTRILLGAIEARLRGNDAVEENEERAASGAVRHVPAPNSAHSERTFRLDIPPRNAQGKGAVGSVRGGRAPDSKRTLGRAWEFIFLCAVSPIGAHYTYEYKWPPTLN